jgi:hypothetical protein
MKNFMKLNTHFYSILDFHNGLENNNEEVCQFQEKNICFIGLTPGQGH